VSFVIRALLWVLLIVAPGGVFLLPLLVGDAMARRKRDVGDDGRSAGTTTSVHTVDSVDPRLAAPASGH
jgi:hypothetical protein